MKAVGIHKFSMTCALGNNLTDIWHHASNASTAGMAVDTDLLFQGSTYLGHVKGIENQPLDAFFDCRVNHLLAHAAKQLDCSAIPAFAQAPANRVGVIVGTSTSGVDEFEQGLKHYDRYGQWARTYQFHHQRMGNVAEFLASYLGATGPAMSISTACSSSAKAVLSAQRWLNAGMCDVVVVGGVDVLCQLTVNGFNALGALSKDPCLPFSANRDGINIGEAAALFVLSNKIDDINVLGGGESSDAHHISAPDPSGHGAIKAMQGALKQARVSAHQVDYINLHGTGTKQNDEMEAKAIDAIFGGSTQCSSTKGMTGHTLGAAGALELALCALSMSEYNKENKYLPHVFDNHYDDQIAPINLVDVHNSDGRPGLVLSNSFAFGGSNASVVLGSREFLDHDE